MSKHIAIIQGHPDPAENHFCHALANAYSKAAKEAGHEIKTIVVTKLDFPLLRTQQEFESGSLPDTIREAQDIIRWAEHLLIIYPLWHGSMPAILKGFFEQAFRYGFAMSKSETNKWPKKLLSGKSAHIVVTMGMPALIYRWYYFSHSLKSLERNILSLCGIKPIKKTIIGMVDAGRDADREKWLVKMQAFGSEGK